MKPTKKMLEREERLRNNYGLNEPDHGPKIENVPDSINENSCSGKGKIFKTFTTLENYQVVKYVNFFTGKTEFKEAGGLPFIKFPWKTNIELIDLRDKIINFPQIEDFRSKDGVSIVTDLFVQYKIVDVNKYILNSVNLREKISENVRSIMQRYFRNNDSDVIQNATISIENVGKDKFQSLEEQYGIKFTRFGTNKLKLPELDDDYTRRKEMSLRMETKQQQLKMQEAQLGLQRAIAEFVAETDNNVRTKKIENIKSLIASFPKEQQAAIFQKIYEIENLKDNANVTYVSGAENLNNFYNNPNKGRRR